MFKRNIKIILVGLFSLILMVLAYSLLGNSPEIISDESLRIEEPAAPSMKAEIEIDSGNAVTLSPMSDSQIESSLESKLIDQPVANYREDLMANSEKISPVVIPVGDTRMGGAEASSILEQNGIPKTNVADNSVLDAQMVATDLESPFRDDAIKRFELNNKRSEGEDSFLSFELKDEAKDVVAYEVDIVKQADQFEQKSDVAIIPDQTEFLDLNLSEVKPSNGMVLVEGDQLIVDDINQALIGYDVEDTEVIEKNDAEVSVAPQPMASVFSAPDVDDALMQGDSEISKQYRETMAKLISINAKLRTADEENTQLQRQFEMSVMNNQQLAQIIRDIDDQIKTFTSTN
jgi:hypothetical protein